MRSNSKDFRSPTLGSFRAYEASAELGQKMIEVSMVDLLKRIK